MVKILLDNGHGYDTPGKRSPIWPDGSQLFEWEFNRDIVSRIEILLKKAGISCVRLVPKKKIFLYRNAANGPIRSPNKVIVYLSLSMRMPVEEAVEKCLPIQVVTKANHTPKYFETSGKIIFPNFVFEVVKKRISVY